HNRWGSPSQPVGMFHQPPAHARVGDALNPRTPLLSLLSLKESVLETELEVEAKAIAAVCERVRRSLTRQLKDVLKFDANAIALDVAGTRHEPQRIDETVFHEYFAIGQPVECGRLPRARAQREFDARTSAETSLPGDGVAGRVRDATPLESRQVVKVDACRVRHEDLHTDVRPELTGISLCLAVCPVDKEAANAVEPAPRPVIDIRNRDTIRLHATRLVIEPDIRCARKITRNRVR